MSNKTPFVFGVKAEGENFTDRREETKNLLANFQYGVNTILISPRRMGKTSLVEKVCNMIDDNEIRIVRIDAFGTRCEIDFINAFATAVIRATSTKWEEYNPNNNTTDEILKLPELIANQKGYKIIVCIDEFQQIGEYSDSLTFQKKLRSVWQLQKNVSYCMYGSKKHMMEKIFLNRSYPFYRFGDVMYLKKISERDWVDYICERFDATGKKISRELAQEVTILTECYSSYVQHLAWFLWLKTENEATEDDLRYAINRLLDSQEALFIQQTEGLSDYQMNFLHAIADGVHTGFTQKSVLSKYRLGTSANITRLKNTLKEKDLIETTEPRSLDMSDPILKLWLKKRVWSAYS